MDSNFFLHNSNQYYIRNDENMVAVFCRHFFFFFKKILPLLFFLAVFISLTVLFFYYSSYIPRDYRYILIISASVLLSFFYLYLILKVIKLWLDYKFDNLVITTKRVFFIDRHFLRGRTIVEIPLERVIGVRSHCNNIVANILGYERLEIDSAVDNQHIVFDYASKVNVIKSILNDTKNNFMKNFHNMHADTNSADLGDNDKMSKLLEKEKEIRTEIELLKKKIDNQNDNA